MSYEKHDDALQNTAPQASLPTGAVSQNMNRLTIIEANLTTLTSGTLYLTALPLAAGQKVTSLSFTSGTTAANGPTHWWFGLFDSSYVALRFTADQTSTAWNSSTTKTVALTSSYTITTSGLYYAGIMMSATSSCVSLLGVAKSNQQIINGIAPILNLKADTGQTSVPSLPFTATFSANNGQVPYVYAS